MKKVLVDNNDKFSIVKEIARKLNILALHNLTSLVFTSFA
jgi:hypothetical protein